jgi:hypothetical protein
MKKIIVIFYLCLLPVALVYAQPATDSVCRANLEKIFKVLSLRIKYESIEHLYELSERDAVITVTLQKHYGHYFEDMTGVPLDTEYYKGTTAVKISITEFVKQLNYPPSRAWQEYRDFIQHLKSEKELCLKCIDAELAKGDLSKYVNKKMSYYYRFPGSSLLGLFVAKLDYLKVFKEFILIDNEEVLPHGYWVTAYLTNGCKANKYNPVQ